MKIVSIPIEMREKTGSAESRRLRRAGKLPASLYGLDRPSVSVQVDTHAFAKEFARGSRMFELGIDDKTQVCLLKDVQYDALGDTLMHVDFNRVDDTTPVTLSVRLDFVGEPEAVAGASLEQISADIIVRCLPRAIPDLVEISQVGLEPGQHIEAKDVVLPAGVELADHPEKTIVTYHFRHAPVEEVDEAEGGDEGAEPEVLTERKPTDEDQG